MRCTLSVILSSLPLLCLAVESEQKCLSQPSDDHTLNKAYHYLNTKFCQPAVWFDSFFEDERITKNTRAGTRIRWRNDVTYFEHSGFKYDTKIDAKFNLPKVNQRIKLVIESDVDEELLNRFPRASEESENRVGLRYDWINKNYNSFNFKVTFRPSIEARYQFTYPLTINNTLRITQKLYQKKKVTGELSKLDLDFALNENFLLRWSSFARYDWNYDTKNSLWDLGTGFTLYQYLSKTQAINYTISTAATDTPALFIDNTLLGITYRQNVFFEWFFYEITPEYNWHRRYKHPFTEEASIRLRLEVLFNNF